MSPLPTPIRTGLLAGALGCLWLQAGDLPPGIHAFLPTGTAGEALPGTLIQVARDRDGVLWACGDFGVYRLAGNRFIRAGAAMGLPEVRILNLVAPREGGLWVVTPGECYFLKDGHFHPASSLGHGPLPGPSCLLLPGVGLLALQPLKALWVRGQEVQEVPALPNSFGLAAWSSRNELIVATADRLFRLEGGQWVATPYQGAVPRALLRDRQHTLWLRTTAGLLQDAGTPYRFRPVPGDLPSCNQASLVEDPQGRIYTNSLRGIHWYDQGQWRHLGEAEGLPEVGADFPFHLDPNGHLWVGGNGLLHFPTLTSRVNFTRRQGLPSHVVWAVARNAAGVLWAATSDGLARLGPQGFEALPGSRGRALLALGPDGQGGLLAGGYPCGPQLMLDAIDRQGRMRRVLVEGLSGGVTISGLALDSGGTLRMGSMDGGAYRLVPTPRGFRAELDSPGGTPNRCLAFNRGTDDALWACFDHGIGRLGPKGWTLLTPEDGLLSASVQATVETRPGERWISYEHVRGLTRLLRDAEGTWRVADHLPPTHPMASNVISGLSSTPDGILVAGTGRGLKVRWPDGRMRRFGREEGFLGEDCIQGALLLEQQRWWVGTQGGLVALDRRGIMPLPAPPPVRVTDLENSQGVALPLRPGEAVPAGDRTLTFRFHATADEGGADHHYQVRLLGQDPTWRTQPYQEAHFTGLSWGLHTFEVRVQDWEGRLGPVSRHQIRVPRPWYAQWWAMGLGLLGLAGLFRLATTLRTRTLRRRAEALEAEVKLRTLELEEMYEALLASSITDPLTGLRNRKDMGDILREEAAQVARVFRTCQDRGETPAGRREDLLLFLMDLDHFKRINDTLGHPVGDEVLAEAAQRLIHATRESDLKVRWGGEEFLLVARRADRHHATVIARHLLEVMRTEPVVLEDGSHLHLTASVGFAVYPMVTADAEGLSLEETLALADQALYAAKRGGRDAWVGLLEADGAETCRTFLARREGQPGLQVVSSLEGPLRWTGATEAPGPAPLIRPELGPRP